MSANPLGWFEIPVTDLDRAVQFYTHVFGWELQIHQMGLELMAWLPYHPGAAGCSGALVKYEPEYVPSDKNGVVIYFSCEDVAATLEKVTEAGGLIIRAKTAISESIGYMGTFLDSEGNRIALHSKN